MKTKIMFIMMLIIAILLSLSGCIYSSLSTNYCDNETIVKYSDRIGINQNFIVAELDGNYYTQFDFNGVYTVWEFNSDNAQNLCFDYKVDLDSGDVRLVLIDPNDQIIDIIPLDYDLSTIASYETEISSGNYRIKLLGKKDATGTLMIKINQGRVSGVERGEDSDEY